MNVGDSRAIASIKGHPVSLSYDHKPNNIGEQTRIIKAGGFVELNRVNGNLALSRALGDFSFKRNLKKQQDEQVVTGLSTSKHAQTALLNEIRIFQICTAVPDVTVHDINTDLEFVVVACDGIWDVLSNIEVVEFCRQRVANHMEPSKICEELISRCLATECNQGGVGCDNMTVILICFLHGESFSHLAKKCSRPSNLMNRNGPIANGASMNTAAYTGFTLPTNHRYPPPGGANTSKLFMNSSQYGSKSNWRY